MTLNTPKPIQTQDYSNAPTDKGNFPPGNAAPPTSLGSQNGVGLNNNFPPSPSMTNADSQFQGRPAVSQPGSIPTSHVIPPSLSNQPLVSNQNAGQGQPTMMQNPGLPPLPTSQNQFTPQMSNAQTSTQMAPQFGFPPQSADSGEV